jgi:hypothetical protein
MSQCLCMRCLPCSLRCCHIQTAPGPAPRASVRLRTCHTTHSPDPARPPEAHQPNTRPALSCGARRHGHEHTTSSGGPAPTKKNSERPHRACSCSPQPLHATLAERLNAAHTTLYHHQQTPRCHEMRKSAAAVGPHNEAAALHWPHAAQQPAPQLAACGGRQGKVLAVLPYIHGLRMVRTTAH